MSGFELNRRQFLGGACSIAAMPLFTPASFAAAPGEKRLVTIILRGAMDGLYLVQPYGDANLKTLRPDFALDPSTGLFDLDGHFGLHPTATGMQSLYKQGELAIVHAVSTPYRSARSHFDGQDILESGGKQVSDEKTGWLNRAMSAIPRSAAARAIDVNSSAELILSGPNRVDVWSSNTDLSVPADDIAFLERLYRGDPAFAKALAETLAADKGADAVFGNDARGKNAVDMAKLTAGMLKGDYRIASFSISGWDTHVGQAHVFDRPLKALDACLTELKAGLGPEIWGQTIVLAMTEFGRTVRQNGSRGTDHGTGGLALVAGGGIKGGKVYGDWPGLADNRLLDNRDLMPTGDVRAIAAHVLGHQFSIGRGDLVGKVFPGLDLGKTPGFLG